MSRVRRKKTTDDICRMSRALSVRIEMAQTPSEAWPYRWSRTLLAMCDQTWSLNDLARVMEHAIREAKRRRGADDERPTYEYCQRRLKKARRVFGDEGSITW